MEKLAQFCYRRRGSVVIAWVGLLIGLFALSAVFAGEFRTEFRLPGSESQEAYDLLEERGAAERTGIAGQIVFSAEPSIDEPAFRTAMESFFAAVTANVEGTQVISPYEPGNEHQVAPSRQVAYAELNIGDRDWEQYLDDSMVIKDLRDDINVEGLEVELGGDLFAEAPAFSSEFIGIAAAIVILLFAFRSLLAAGLPIVTALFGVGCGAALIGLVTRVLDVPDFTTQVAAMIGIGVGIDYALLIVTRYRQALHDGMEPLPAVSLALTAAGRAVVFAGLTVVISLVGMFMMDLDFMRSVATGAILGVLMTMLASVTLLPALLGFAGHKIDRLSLPHRRPAADDDPTSSWWYRWSRVIQSHPWPALIGSVALLVVIGLPVFALQLGFGDAGNRPATDTSRRRAYDLLSEGFGPGFNSPILAVADTPGGDASGLPPLKTALEETEGVARVTEPIPLADGTLQVFNIYPTSAPQDKETSALVHRIRDEVVPTVPEAPRVLLTGGPPGVVDFADYMSDRLPLFFGAVLILSFLLLMAVFRSIVVPLKAVIMNMLSIGAAFGALVAVFQWGFLSNLIGLDREGPVEAWVPMMLFAIVFGLSMDYEVFLLTRVREEYDRTHDNARAVADGLAATGRVISAAAAIMVCVFASFILNDDRSLKLFGFGLAFAVFIDATLVRLVLVPATMELLGDRNWWFPRWLDRIVPVIHVDTVNQRPAAVGRDPAQGD